MNDTRIIQNQKWKYKPKGTKIGGGGNRTRRPEDVTPCNTRTANTADDVCCIPGCTPIPHDADLAALIAAWPTLPEPLRAGITAMVRAAATKHGRNHAAVQS